MNKRSLTLLELLVAMALVIALGALIFPSLVSSLEERTFESAADDTSQQLIMARAHAQATGSPVEVTYRADVSQVQVRRFGATHPANSSPAEELRAKERATEDEPAGARAAGDGGATVDLIGEAWDILALAPGIRFTNRPPGGEAETSETDSANEALSKAGQFDELLKGQEVRLAVFMPDGSALAGEPVWMNDQAGRRGVLKINPWNGLPSFERMANEHEGADGGATRGSSEKRGSGEAPDDADSNSGGVTPKAGR